MRRIVVFLGMVLILVLGVGRSVMAFSLEEKAYSREEYRRMETEYIEKIRLVLLEKGCKNAGITLTYVTDKEEKREYTVTVHHRKLENMEQQEWELLQARIRECGVEMFTEPIAMVKILSDR